MGLASRGDRHRGDDLVPDDAESLPVRELPEAREEVDKGIEEMSATYNHPFEEIQNYYRENKDKLEVFKHALLEKRAINLIIENGAVEEIEAKVETTPESESTANNT